MKKLLFLLVLALSSTAVAAPIIPRLRILDEGTQLPLELKLNFIGSSISCVDNPSSGRTDCTLTGGSSTQLCAYSIDYLWFDGAVPANGTTVTIAGHVFKFVTALPAQDTNTNIKIAGTVNGNLDLLVEAVNGTVDATNIRVSSPDFTTAVGAARDTTYGFYIYNSATRGGAIATGTKSVACSTTVTTAGWWNSNLNAMPGDLMPAGSPMLFTNIPTSDNLFNHTAGQSIALRLNFVPTRFTASIFSPAEGSFITDDAVSTWIQPDGVTALIPFAYSGGAYPGAIITVIVQ